MQTQRTLLFSIASAALLGVIVPIAARAQNAAEAPRVARPAAAAPAAQLRLDAAEPAGAGASAGNATEQALAAIDQANAAVREAIVAASATARRVAALEQDNARLRIEAERQRALAVELRGRDEASRQLLMPLLLACAALLGLAGWLGWRLRALGGAGGSAAASAAAAGPSSRSAATAVPSGMVPIRMPQAATHRRQSGFVVSSGFAGDATPPAAEEPAATMPAPVFLAETSSAARAQPPARPPPPAPAPPPTRSAVRPAERPEPVSSQSMTRPFAPADVARAAHNIGVEELIDLEQQAEFFSVLGQDEEAIELLAGHLRQTGGSSPLPYLKLMEIHAQRREREAYERMRARFDVRFNAHAPPWGADLQSGRPLLEHAPALARIQQVWARPLDAVALIDSLLPRREGGENFDLPAFRDLMLLHAIARELHEREQPRPPSVDLLLPLGGATADDGACVDESNPDSVLDVDLSAGPGAVDSLFVALPTPPR